MQLEMFNEPSITRLAADIGTSYKRQLTDQVKVRTITLDTYVEQKAIAKVDVIKIDVEGAELFVLEGARSILERLLSMLQ